MDLIGPQVKKEIVVAGALVQKIQYVAACIRHILPIQFNIHGYLASHWFASARNLPARAIRRQHRRGTRVSLLFTAGNRNHSGLKGRLLCHVYQFSGIYSITLPISLQGSFSVPSKNAVPASSAVRRPPSTQKRPGHGLHVSLSAPGPTAARRVIWSGFRSHPQSGAESSPHCPSGRLHRRYSAAHPPAGT